MFFFFRVTSVRVRGRARTEVRGDQAVVGCSRLTQSMGSCDVEVLLWFAVRMHSDVLVSNCGTKWRSRDGHPCNGG